MEVVTRIDLDRECSTPAILVAAGRLYLTYPWLFLILAAAVVAPWDLTVLAVTGHGPLGHTRSIFTYWLAVSLLRSTFVGPPISALHIHAVAIAGRGERPRLGEVARRGVRVLPVAAAAGAASSIAIVIGLLMAVLPGLVLLVAFAVGAQAAAVEDRNWFRALGSSRELTAVAPGHAFALVIAAGVLNYVFLQFARALPLGASSGAPAVLLGIAAETLVASFIAIALALLYYDLKARAAAAASESAPA